ncbi:hypothetical protein QBC43DRAFT_288483 [Cladorrhinum sp. PSN259]|nr:hypothetical protein QBC43DRAFT_288483 [Cladorrhinum sp. PSN259]
MDIPLCIIDPAVTAGQPAVDGECATTQDPADDHANRAAKTQTESKSDDDNESANPEDFRAPPDFTNTNIRISTSVIEPSLFPYVVPLSPVSDESPPTITVTTTEPTVPTATPQSALSLIHTPASQNTFTPTTTLPETAVIPATPPLPLITTKPTIASANQITVGTLTISPPTTFRTVTPTDSSTIIIDTIGGIPSDSSADSISSIAGHSNLLTVGGSTVLAGAVITAGIFLLVRYVMKVRRRRRWAVEDEACRGPSGLQNGEEVVDGEKNSGSVNTGVMGGGDGNDGTVQEMGGGIAGSAAQVWGQAGAHHAGFV